jgi:hypothetical protein
MIKAQDVEPHGHHRCLVSETQIFGSRLKLRDFEHVNEICEQMFADQVGVGINGKWRRR